MVEHNKNMTAQSQSHSKCYPICPRFSEAPLINLDLIVSSFLALAHILQVHDLDVLQVTWLKSYIETVMITLITIERDNVRLVCPTF